MNEPKILVFASGSPAGGGSGFKNLALASRDGNLGAEIVGVVSNHMNGGVHKHAQNLDIPFYHFPKPYSGDGYQHLARHSKAGFFALSGWLKLVTGLDPETPFNSRTVFNIHPGPLPTFGGAGLYGHHVHEAVMAAYRQGEISHSAVTMHFVTEEYDRGPTFLRFWVRIRQDDTPETLAARVNRFEHLHQPRITSLVANGLISWNGWDPASLKTPDGYSIEQFEPPENCVPA